MPRIGTPSPVLALDLWIGSPYFVGANNNIALAATTRGHVHQFQVNRAVTVSTAWFGVGAQAGNMDIAIYRYDSATVATRIASTGSFAVPAVNLAASRALTASVTLLPGVKYGAAIACDNIATATFTGANVSNLPFPTTQVDLHGDISTGVPLPASFDPTTAMTQIGRIYAIRFS